MSQSKLCAETKMAGASGDRKRQKAGTASKMGSPPAGSDLERTVLVRRLDRAALEQLLVGSTVATAQIRNSLDTAKQTMVMAAATPATAKQLREGDTGNFQTLSAELQVGVLHLRRDGPCTAAATVGSPSSGGVAASSGAHFLFPRFQFEMDNVRPGVPKLHVLAARAQAVGQRGACSAAVSAAVLGVVIGFARRSDARLSRKTACNAQIQASSSLKKTVGAL